MTTRPTRIPDYVRRAFRFQQMDFDFALSQMIGLCFAPISVYKVSSHRKLTKNHWSRDDPAFCVLQVIFLVCASIAFAVAFQIPQGHPILSMLKLVLWEVFVHYFLFGQTIATITWYVSNRYLVMNQLHATRQEVEWLYAWDIHCNAFFPMFLLLYVVQFISMPLLLSSAFIPRLLSNALYTLAFSHYHYITFRGFVELPFLQHQQYFLYPIGGLVVAFVLCTIVGFSATQFVVNLYFPSQVVLTQAV